MQEVRLLCWVLRHLHLVELSLLSTCWNWRSPYGHSDGRCYGLYRVWFHSNLFNSSKKKKKRKSKLKGNNPPEFQLKGGLFFMINDTIPMRKLWTSRIF